MQFILLVGTIPTREVIEAARSQLPSLPVFSRRIPNWSRNTLRIPAFSTCRTFYELLDSFKFLSDGSPFLAFDGGIDESDRILIFATKSSFDD